MSYIQKTLLVNENILYHTKPHYIIFFSVFLWLIVGIILDYNSLPIGNIFLIIALFDFLNKLISYYCSEYALTNKRIIVKIGFVRRQSFEIFLDRVEGVYIDQSIVGRILDFGSVIICGVGGSKNPFFYIPKPLEFYNRVQKQIPTKKSDSGK